MPGDLRKTMLRRQFKTLMSKAETAERKGEDEKARQLYAKALVARKKLVGEMSDKEKQRREEVREARVEETKPASGAPEARGTSQGQGGGRAEQASQEVQTRVEDTVLAENPSTTWEDIGGLEEVKARVREAVRLPWIEELPEFVEPWRGILLYGPPGTGKTMIARAATNELDATFFQLDAGTVLSKYYGESAQIVSEVFDHAREQAPSVIFVDEIDSLAPARSGDVHEESRRALNQFLQEQEGLESGEEDVLLIGATNTPWDVDEAQISRFQKRIRVPLPDQPARRQILEIHLRSADVEEGLVDELAEATEGLTGRDLQAVTQEAIMTMVREENPDLAEMPTDQLREYRLATRRLERGDFEGALEDVDGRTDDRWTQRFETWQEEFGRS